MTSTAFFLSSTPFIGTTALVTGGAKRLGRAIALALAEGGADLVLHYHHSQSDAEITAQAIHAKGRRVWLLRADLTEERAALSLLEEARKVGGEIHYLVNNASSFGSSTLDTLTLTECIDAFRLNAFAPLLLSRAFAEYSKARAIVHLLDRAIIGINRAHVAYCLSKRMLHTLTLWMAHRYYPRVRVNAVAPGRIHLEEKIPQETEKSPPKPFDTRVEDVVEAVLFLLLAHGITGQTLFVGPPPLESEEALFPGKEDRL